MLKVLWQLDNETTAFNTDHREQLDLSTPQPLPGPAAPLYHNLLAPNQWPSESHLPSFRPVYEEYMSRMEEALGDAYSEPVADVRGYVESVKAPA